MSKPYTSILTRKPRSISQRITYRNGFVFHIKATGETRRGVELLSISDFESVTCAVFTPDGKRVDYLSANVPEWLAPVYAEMGDPGELAYWQNVDRDTARWIHEEMLTRVTRPHVDRIGDWIVRIGNRIMPVKARG